MVAGMVAGDVAREEVADFKLGVVAGLGVEEWRWVL